MSWKPGGNELVAQGTRHIETVDAARGLLAIGVMTYHVLGYEHLIALEQIGYYAVHAFFVISGFSLYYTYRDRMTDSVAVRSYLIRRFFRLGPLYILLLVINGIVSRVLPSPLRLASNVSLLFGFANPGTSSLVTGGWSIGIEMVFYLLLPVILAVAGGSLRRMAIVAAVVSLLQILFVNSVLGGFAEMSGEAWSAYVQPLSFAGYFVAGCLLAEVFRRAPALKGSPVAWGVCAVAIVPFFFSPTTPIEMLTGWIGLGLSLAVCLFVAGAVWLPEPRVALLATVARWLGAVSYAVYLLHPIVYQMVDKAAHGPTAIFATYFGTFVLATLVSRFIELPGRALGRRVALQAA
jgi:exopolysaccharide production protein ExoZ